MSGPATALRQVPGDPGGPLTDVQLGYSPTPTLPKWLCAWRTPAFAIGTSAPSADGSSPSSLRWPANAVDTAASTPAVTVGPGSWARFRITVRTLRTPSGRALLRSAGRESACGGTSPASTSRTNCRCARAARKLRHGSAAPRNDGGARHRRHLLLAAEQPCRQRRRPDAVAKRMGGLQHRYRAHTGTGQPVDGCEHVQPPGHPASVQLVFGQPRDRRQTIPPSCCRRDRAGRIGRARRRRSPTPGR